jgi:hypothetical protein
VKLKGTQSAEGAKWRIATEDIAEFVDSISRIHRWEFGPISPGPMARAFTFRAFGVENSGFSHHPR